MAPPIFSKNARAFKELTVTTEVKSGFNAIINSILLLTGAVSVTFPQQGCELWAV